MQIGVLQHLVLSLETLGDTDCKEYSKFINLPICQFKESNVAVVDYTMHLDWIIICLAFKEAFSQG